MTKKKHHTDDANGSTSTDTKDKLSTPLIIDQTLTPCVFFEPPFTPTTSSTTCTNKPATISPTGLDHIAQHQYRPSSPTHLDTLLNPTWTYLTDLLPLWLAPNMVTTFGGLHCGVAYAVCWWYAPDFDVSPPDWVVLLSGYCTVAYYTLDCMDGKQSRRTGTSSPLGQLFDHGFDCICTLAHLSTVSSYLSPGGTLWYILLQTSLQLAFFMAQWEEYHTHVLPHCAGKWCGVTEVNYALGVLAIGNAFLDREWFYTRRVEDWLGGWLGKGFVKTLPAMVKEMETRHFMMTGWGIMSTVLMILSVIRVVTHPRIAPPSCTPRDRMQRRLNALSKLFTPVLLCVAAFMVPPMSVRTRYLSVSLGLAFSLLTKKIIVYSMARMAFAVVQWDALPFLLAAAWIRFDERLTKMGADFILGILCLWYTWRMLRWVNITVGQICERLDIYCFTIKKRKKI